MSKLPMIRPHPTRIIYVFATVGVFLFVMAFIWFLFYAIIQPISATMTPVADSFYNSSWSLDQPFTLATSFMDSFWQFLLMFAVFGLALWVYSYSQRRGRQY